MQPDAQRIKIQNEIQITQTVRLLLFPSGIRRSAIAESA